MEGMSIAEIILSLFGQGRAVLGSWPERGVLSDAFAVFEEMGAKKCGEYGSPAGEIEVFLFRLNGRRLRLCVDEYGAIRLFGPKRMVTELAAKVSEHRRAAI